MSLKPYKLNLLTSIMPNEDAYKSDSQIRQLAEQHFAFAQQYLLCLQFVKAIAFYKQANELFQTTKQVAQSAQCLQQIGKAYFEIANFSKALHYFFLALSIEKNIALENTNTKITKDKDKGRANQLNKNKEATSVTIAAIYSNIGAVYLAQGNYAKAMAYFYSTAQNVKKENSLLLADTYFLMSICCEKQMQLQEKNIYLEQAKNIYQTYYQQYRTGKFQGVASNYLRINNQIALQHAKAGKVKHAINTLQKIVKTNHTLLLSKQQAALAETHEYLALCYALIKQPQKQLNCLHQSLAVLKNAFPNQKNKYYAHLYQQYGQYYTEQQQYSTALSYYQKALTHTLINYNNSDVFHNPILPLDSASFNLLSLLYHKGSTLFKWYKSTSNILHKSHQPLKAAAATLQTTILIVQHFWEYFYNGETKAWYSEIAKAIFSEAIAVSSELFKLTKQTRYKEQIYIYMEKSKLFSNNSNPLYSIHFKQKEVLLDKKTNSLLQNAKQYSQQLQILNGQINTWPTKDLPLPEKQALINSLRKQQAQYYLQYDLITAALKDEIPAIYSQVSQTKVAAITAIQKQLNTTSTIIEYFISDEKINICLITHDKFEIMEVLCNANQLTKLIRTCNNAVIWLEQDLLIDTAKQLYKFLITPIVSFLKDKKHLKIIPSPELATLSFDLLVTGNSNTSYNSIKDIPYLIRCYESSYHFSATTWLTQLPKHQNNLKQADSFVGFAPVSFGKQPSASPSSTNSSSGTNISATLNIVEEPAPKLELMPSDNPLRIANKNIKKLERQLQQQHHLNNLKLSATELTQIKLLFTSKSLAAAIYLKEQANKRNIIQEISNYKFVHIATHGFMKDGISGLYLQAPTNNNAYNYGTNKNAGLAKLPTYEVMELQVNASLVILSSCRSGAGKFRNGQATVGLHRAFMEAGASNIVFSFFAIPDDSTAILMQTLFEKILTGCTYAEALRFTKLQLIDKTAYTPLDWAGFGLIAV